jgi:hypothetical protein
MSKLTAHRHWFGLASLLALALAGGAGFKWNCTVVVEWLMSLL